MSSVAQQSLTYGEYIAACIRQVAHKIRTEDAGVAFLRLVSAALLYVLGAVALDHLFDLSAVTRTAMLVLAVSTGAAYGYLGLVRPLVRRINAWYVARVMDRVVPELEDGVTTVLDLEHHGDDPAARLARPVVEDRVVQVLIRVPVEQRLGAERLLRAWYLLAAAVVLCCLGLLINSLWLQRSVLASLGRILIPWADIGYPTRTRIVDVRPGDDPQLSKAVAGSDVTVSAMVEGFIPKEVLLYWSDDGGKKWHRVRLNQPDNNLDPWWVKLSQVEKSFTYYLTGGDCTTKLYQFTVLPVPMVQRVEVRYEFPEYTGREPIVSDLPDIDALAGTRVTITALLPGRARQAALVLGRDKRQRLPMHRLPGDAKRVAASFTVTQDDVYRIWFVLEDGASNPNPPLYQIRCRQDQPPELRIDQPGHDLVEPPVPLNRSVPIVVQARDDFGLRSVELVIELPGSAKRHESLLDGFRETRTEAELRYELSPERLGLKPGDEIRYWAVAADNRRPGAQRTESQKYRVRFGDAQKGTSLEDQDADRTQDTERADGQQQSRRGEKGEQPDQPPSLQQPAEAAEPEAGAEPGAAAEPETGQRVEDPEEALERIREFFEEQEQPQTESQAEGGGAQEQPDAGAGQAEQGEGADRSQEGQQGVEEMAPSDEPAEQAAEGQQPGQQGETAAAPDQAQATRGANRRESEQAAAQADQRAAGQDQADRSAEAEGKNRSGKAAGASQDEQPPQGTDEPGTASPTTKDQTGGSEPGSQGEAQSARHRQEATEGRRDGPEPNGSAGQGSRAADEGQGAEETGRAAGEPARERGPELPEGAGLTGARKSGSDGAEGAEPGETSGQAGREPGGEGAQPQRQADQPGAQEAEGRRSGGETGIGAPAGGESAGQEGGQQGGTGAGEERQGGARSAEQVPGGQNAERGGQGGRSGAQQGGQRGGQQGTAGSEQGGAERGTQGQGSGGQQKPSGGQPGHGQGEAAGRADGGAKQDGQGQPGAGKNGTPGGQGGPQGGQAAQGQSSGGRGGPGQAPGAGSSQQGAHQVGGGAGPAAGGRPQRGPGTGEQQGLTGGGPAKRPRPGGGGGQTEEPPQQENISQAARKATELVLTRLEDMLNRNAVDPELLRRLGWTEEDLRRFVKYLKAKQQQERAGRIGRVHAPRRSMLSGPQSVVSEGDNAIDVSRTPPPPEYREIIEAYSRSLSGDR